MVKLLGFVLTITRRIIFASAFVIAAASPIGSGPAIAYDVIIPGESGGDTVVTHTYDDKTNKLLKVKRSSEIDDPNDRTKITKKLEIKRYEQGKRPPYETSVEEQEIVLVERNGRRNRVVRKQTMVTTTYTKTKRRDLVVEVKEETELVRLDAKGKPVYEGKRTTTKGKGALPEKNEIWDARTGTWVDMMFAVPYQTTTNQQQPAGEQTSEAPNTGGTHYLVDDELNRTEIIRNEDGKPGKTNTARRQEDINKERTKPEETNTARRQEGGKPSKSGSEEDRPLDAGGNGMLTGKSVRLSDLEGCSTPITGFVYNNVMGITSTHCPSLTGGRVATQADYSAYCSRFEDRGGQYCGPPGPDSDITGVYGMPLYAFCISLHFGILSKESGYNEAAKHGGLSAVYQYDNGSRRLECFYLSKEQAKILIEQKKNLAKDPGPAQPVAKAKPKKDCKGGGLVGAIDCVTKRIEGAGGTGARTTGKPPDSAPPTIKKDNRRPRRNAGKSPASASATDPSTGETITSVGNPDGSRTVTRTDSGGNILSREKVR